MALLWALGLLFLCEAKTIIRGNVIHVLDGDTITVLEGKTQHRIRLAEIDAPEKKQPFGSKSHQYLKDRIHGKAVTASCSSKDRYGRWLCFIYDKKNKNINLELVQEGFAWSYSQYVTLKDIEKAQKNAKKQQKGLWADQKAMPPWEWRRQYGDRKKVRLSFEGQGDQN